MPSEDSRTVARRRFLSSLVSLGGIAAASSVFGWTPDFAWADSPASASQPGTQTLVRYPQKTDLILLTDRPPQLETPLRYFATDLTPNDAFFVRWHLSGIPTTVDLQTFRLEVGGQVNKPMSLSLSELRSKFEPVTMVALAQCAGNFRSMFEPRVAGGQWGAGCNGQCSLEGRSTERRPECGRREAGSGAGGAARARCSADAGDAGVSEVACDRSCARWRSDDRLRNEWRAAADVERLSHSPDRAGVVRDLLGQVTGHYHRARSAAEDVLDGQGLSYPRQSAGQRGAAASGDGHGADQPHVGALDLSEACTRASSFAPDSAISCRDWQTMATPGIKRVEVSKDGGQSWSDATLGPDLGKYSWRRWQADWTPAAKGSYKLMVRATSASGETQVTSQWNRSGYQRDVIEQQEVVVA